MKVKIFLGFGLVTFALATMLSSCNEPEDELLKEVTVNLTEETRDFLFNSSAARSKVRANGIGGPAGFIFRLGGGVISSRNRTENEQKTSPLMTMRALVNADRNFLNKLESNNNPEELPACINESFVENKDGSYEYILDFGVGCDFFGETFKGKLIEKGIYTDKSFIGFTTYEGFGTDFWEVNGNYSYDGIWEYSKNNHDSLIYDWSAEYSYRYDLEETYEDSDDSFSIISKGSGKENSDQKGYTVMEQENHYLYDSGESFTSKVDIPLHLRYDCGDEVFIFISGEESGVYNYKEISATYSVNYGDGTCDNVIVVTENGEKFTIDLDAENDDLD